METSQTALKLMRPGCFMASVNLKDAYYSIPIAAEDQQLLKFVWEGNYFNFTRLPNGLASAPRLFTKVLKPVFANLWAQGRSHWWFLPHWVQLCSLWGKHCSDSQYDLFLKLGFVIHPTKSVLVPTQELEFLGFILNSVSMTIRLPPVKAAIVQQACENLPNKDNPTIRAVGSVIGLIVSSLPGVQFGELHYRYLEHNKIETLQANKGDYDAFMTLSQEARADLHWWAQNVTSAFRNIMTTDPDFIPTTDASNTGWGAVQGTQKTAGLWNLEEQAFHINYLELKAVLLGLKSLCATIYNKHIRIQYDNTIFTVAHVNAMGGIKSAVCNVWLSKLGSGVEKERFGLLHAIFLAQPMSRPTLNLETPIVLQSGLYTQMCLHALIKCGDLFMWTFFHKD